MAKISLSQLLTKVFNMKPEQEVEVPDDLFTVSGGNPTIQTTSSNADENKDITTESAQVHKDNNDSTIEQLNPAELVNLVTSLQSQVTELKKANNNLANQIPVGGNTHTVEDNLYALYGGKYGGTDGYKGGGNTEHSKLQTT